MAYAVVWNEDGGADFAGKLDLVGGCVVLSGSARDARESQRRLAVTDLADVRLGRLSKPRGGHDQGLVLVRHDGGRIEIASVEAAGTLRELAERIAITRGKPAD